MRPSPSSPFHPLRLAAAVADAFNPRALRRDQARTVPGGPGTGGRLGVSDAAAPAAREPAKTR